jgi:hypothetical protein
MAVYDEKKVEDVADLMVMNPIRLLAILLQDGSQIYCW